MPVVKAQNGDSIYSVNNRIKYTLFLEKNKEYSLLKKEYRQLYLLTNKSDYINQLLLVLLRENNWDSAYLQAQSYQVMDSLNWQCVQLLKLVNGDETAVKYGIKQTKGSRSTDSMLLVCCSRLFSTGPEKTQPLAKKLSEETAPGYLSIEGISLLQNLAAYKKRKPLKAAILSSILPGAGKFYVHRNIDGWATLGTVSVNLLAAVLTYKKPGKQSVWPYAFGALALGFYSGGIYGSAEAAKKENKFVTDQLKQNAKSYLLHYYAI